MLGKRVFSSFFVKVRENWRESHEFVEDLEWRRQVDRLAGPEAMSRSHLAHMQ
jgi:GTP-binding protein Era